MKTQSVRCLFLILSLLSIGLIAGLLSGCESRKISKSKSGGPTLAADEHMHDDGSIHKAGDEHSHDDNGPGHTEGHTHGAGPHGGVLADWGGGKFHVEFTVDHDQQQATVYVFGADEKTVAPIDSTEIILSVKNPVFHLTLKAAPQEGDPHGTSSRFVGTHENLAKVQEFEGSISGTVNGTPYSGNFKEPTHGD